MTHRPPNSLTRRLIAGVVALGYFLTMPGLSQAGVLVASVVRGELGGMQVVIDGAHMDVVLHHHPAEDHEAHDHHELPHGPALAAEDDDHHDHVFHFTTPDPARSLTGGWVRAPQTAVSVALAAELSRPQLLMVPRGSLPHARPPPPASTVMLCLRTTVLLV